MILGDKKIIEEVELGNITISEFDKARINPASYDVLLGDEIAMYLPKIDFQEMKSVFRIIPEKIDGKIEVWNLMNKFLQKSNSFQELLDNLLKADFNLFYEYIHELQEDIIIDPLNKPEVYKFKIPEEGFTIKPNYFYLYTTKERVGSMKYAFEIKNKSSLARLSLLPNFIAGYGDPGFVGQITLEVATWFPLILRKDMKIGQVVFNEVTDVETTYDKKPGSKYNNQQGVQESKYHENYPQPNGI